MIKATPEVMAKLLKIVESYKQMGIYFVPVPCFDIDDVNRLHKEAESKVEKMLSDLLDDIPSNLIT